MREALRLAASALKAEHVPFALAGSYALWVFGAPEGSHDADFAVAESSVEEAVAALSKAGFEIERPPEDWLFKAHHDATMVDVLHRLVGEPVEQDLLDRAKEYDVLGIRLPVLPPTEVIRTQMLAMTERYCDFGALLPGVRAVRERLDWSRLRDETRDHPFGAAFLYLLERLEIAPTAGAGGKREGNPAAGVESGDSRSS